MIFEALALDYDNRLGSFMLSARVDYEWYLSRTSGSEYNLTIQRDIVKGQKSYQTLRKDIARGCVLPPIVLSARAVVVDHLIAEGTKSSFVNTSAEDLNLWSNAIVNIDPANVGIIDGLQRTNALNETLSDIPDDRQASFLRQSLRLEIWINIPFNALAYRMLLLNAGQKPMSMKHQIDILSKGLGDDLESVESIDIIRIKDHRRRVRAGQFHLSTVAQIFQAWLQRNPNVDVRNLVVEQLLLDEAVDALGTDLNSPANAVHRDDFRSLIEWLVDLDLALGDENYRFLGNDTVLLGIAASMGFAQKTPIMTARMWDARERILQQVRSQEDGIGLTAFEEHRRSIDPKKHNVGETTRKLVFEAMREYILQSGETPMKECWNQAATFLDL